MHIPFVAGVTHDPETKEITAQVPRAVKVSIGMPKDSGLHIFPMRAEGHQHLVLEIGVADGVKRVGFKIEELPKLKAEYQRLLKDPEVVKRKHPKKLHYFTFTKDAGDGSQVADIDTIAQHIDPRDGGPMREIPIVITDDRPMEAAYEFWEARGLKCRGNGIDAKRSIHFVTSKEDEAAAKAAASEGKKFFKIIGGCATGGCPWALPTEKGRKQCGLHGSLAFQLVSSIRLGSKAELSTTSFRTIRQLTAGLVELATISGGGDPARGTVRGIPLFLAVTKFKTNVNNKPGNAYSIRLEFKAESIAGVRQKLEEAARTFGGVIAAPAKQIAGPAKQIEAPAAEATFTEANVKNTPAEVLVAEEVADPEDEPETEKNFRESHFPTGDDDDGSGIEDGEVEPEPTETFDDAKADLLMKAEAEMAKEATGTPAAGGTLFSDGADDLGRSRYEDPGEQDKAPKSRMRMRKD